MDKTKYSSSTVPKDGLLRLWQCIICGEEIKAVAPPPTCPVCFADEEIWICIKIFKDKPNNENDQPVEKSSFKGKLVIIGCGTAGVSSLKAIRENNKICEITVFSEEGRPVNRPSLSKSEVKYPFSKDWFDNNKVELITKKVTKINTNKKIVTTGSSESWKYDKLIIAIGSQPNNEFGNAKNVFTVYGERDIIEILKYCRKRSKSNIVIIGCGILGIEMGELLKKKLKDNVKITLIEKSKDRIMPRQLDIKSSEILFDVLKRNGLIISRGKRVDHIEIVDELAKSVFLDDKTKLSCDICIVTIGQKSDLDLAKQIGLKINKLVVVDKKMETSMKDVYAAGNIAEFGGFTIQSYKIAKEQGKIAGLNAIGIGSFYKNTISPYLMNVFDITVYSCGIINTKNFIVKQGKDYYTKLFHENDVVCGVISIGKSVEISKLDSFIENKIKISKVGN